jgi:hypothetical protein
LQDNIIKDYDWCQIIKRQEKYIIRYDTGGVAIKMTEHHISEDEAKLASVGESEAENIIRRIQNKDTSLS